MPRPTRQPPPDERPITDELRAAIRDDGRNLHALALASGVDEASIRRFVARSRSLHLDSADRLAATLRLQLTRKARSRPRPAAAPDIKMGELHKKGDSPLTRPTDAIAAPDEPAATLAAERVDPSVYSDGLQAGPSPDDAVAGVVG